MNEKFLQFVWKHQLYNKKEYLTSSGEKVTIVHPGEINTHAGPDFINTRVKIEQTIWAGNCEIHLNSSDWIRHNHHNDKAYDNVVLHVVKTNDSETFNSLNRLIPCIELDYPKSIEIKYNELLQSASDISCAKQIAKIEKFHISQWLTTLGIARLQRRASVIMGELEQNKHFWEEAFYIHLAHSFGFKVNSLPFELLAKSLPLNVLAKHKNNLNQTEALLFGQAGFLEKNTDDSYYQTLKKEYQYLKHKYQLKSIDNHLWKWLRLRPLNEPTIRIAQFAALINHSTSLFSKVIEAKTIEELTKYFKVQASAFWDTHYSFETISKPAAKKLSDESVYLLLVNSVIPFIFVYGKLKSENHCCDRAVEFMEQLKPEKNSMINTWVELGIKPVNAFESQALLELRNEFCNKRECLNCSIGTRLITIN